MINMNRLLLLVLSLLLSGHLCQEDNERNNVKSTIPPKANAPISLKSDTLANGEAKSEPLAKNNTKSEPLAKNDTKSEPLAKNDTKSEPFAKNDTKSEPFAKNNTPAPPKADAVFPKADEAAGNEKSDEESDNATTEADNQADGEEENGDELPEPSNDQAQDAESDDANGVDKDDNAPGQKEGKINSVGKSSDSKHHETINVSKEESENSHFFAYLVTTAILVAGLYIAYHNKRKIIAFVLEGRRGKGGRRPNGGDYQRLDHKI